MTDSEAKSTEHFSVASTLVLIVVLAVALCVQIRLVEPSSEPRRAEEPGGESPAISLAEEWPAPTEPVIDPAAVTLTRAGFHQIRVAEGDAASLMAAVSTFQQALRLEPAYGDAMFGLGWARQSLSEHAAAEREYLAALTLLRRSPRATDVEHYCHYNLGVVYEQLGRAEASQLHYTLAELLTSAPAAAGFTPARVIEIRQVEDLARSVLSLLAPAAEQGELRLGWRQALAFIEGGELEAAWAALARAQMSHDLR
jgi:hypothetical protein